MNKKFKNDVKKYKTKICSRGCLTMLFCIGFSANVFAYPGNPFVELPKDAWAYPAVGQLAKDGIVDIDNTTFYSDKPITRYEMATIIAKAMTHYEKATPEDKGIIDKLKVEFIEDLKNQGVAMGETEKKVTQTPPPVKISGEYKIVYENDTPTVNGIHQNYSTNHLLYSRSRIVFSGESNGLDYEFRLQNISNLRDSGSSDGTTQLNRSAVGAKMLGGRWVFGRQADHNLDLWITDATIKGVSAYYKVGKVDLVGRFGKEYQSNTSYLNDTGYSSNDEHTVLTASTTIGKTFVGLSYHNLTFSGATDPYNSIDDNHHILGLDMHGKISPNLLLSTAYAKSSSDIENKSYNISLAYGNVNPSVDNSKSFTLAYHYFGINAIYQPNGDYNSMIVLDNGHKMITGIQGLALTYAYVPVKNTALVLTVQPNNKTISYDGKITSVVGTAYYFF